MRKLTDISKQENFRFETKGTYFNVCKREPIIPEPEGTIVLFPFVITGYEEDCDGSLMAQLDHIDFNGEQTGWKVNRIGLTTNNVIVLDGGITELKKFNK